MGLGWKLLSTLCHSSVQSAGLPLSSLQPRRCRGRARQLPKGNCSLHWDSGWVLLASHWPFQRRCLFLYRKAELSEEGQRPREANVFLTASKDSFLVSSFAGHLWTEDPISAQDISSRIEEITLKSIARRVYSVTRQSQISYGKNLQTSIPQTQSSIFTRYFCLSLRVFVIRL